MKTNIESIAMELLDEQSSQWVLVWNRQGYKNITRLQHTPFGRVCGGRLAHHMEWRKDGDNSDSEMSDPSQELTTKMIEFVEITLIIV